MMVRELDWLEKEKLEAEEDLLVTLSLIHI